MRYYEMKSDDASAALQLVQRTFDQYVRSDLSDEGVEAFRRCARSWILSPPAEHFIAVARDGKDIVGLLDIRHGSHVCLFFVDPSRHRQGVGRGLLDYAMSHCSDIASADLTVNASLFAVPVYSSLSGGYIGQKELTAFARAITAKARRQTIWTIGVALLRAALTDEPAPARGANARREAPWAARARQGQW